jgi:hypothetical protein
MHVTLPTNLYTKTITTAHVEKDTSLTIPQNTVMLYVLMDSLLTNPVMMATNSMEMDALTLVKFKTTLYAKTYATKNQFAV